MKVGINVTKGSKSSTTIDMVTVSYTRDITTGNTSIDLSSYNPSTIRNVFVNKITNLQYATDNYQAFTTPNLVITYNSGDSTALVNIATGSRISSLTCNLELALVR